MYSNNYTTTIEAFVSVSGRGIQVREREREEESPSHFQTCNFEFILLCNRRNFESTLPFLSPHYHNFEAILHIILGPYTVIHVLLRPYY